MPTPRRAWPGPLCDAAAALFCGVGVLLMAIEVKPVPASLLDYLGRGVSLFWAGFLLFGSLSAGAGALLRPTRYQVASYAGELFGWPTIGIAASIFTLATIARVGLIDSLLTVGFSGFVAATCCGQYWRLFEAKRLAVQAVGRG